MIDRVVVNFLDRWPCVSELIKSSKIAANCYEGVNETPEGCHAEHCRGKGVGYQTIKETRDTGTGKDTR